MLQRIFSRKRTGEATGSLPVLPDPMNNFPHPGNQEFFQYLMSAWRTQGLPPDEVHAYSPHPPLVALFDRLADQVGGPSGIRKETVYGVRFAATPYHRVFAWAQGRDAIFIKLRPEWYKEALADGGRLDASYPAGWVEFIAGGGRMPPARQAQWFAVISHWIQAGYNDCVQGTAAAGKTETMPEPPRQHPMTETAALSHESPSVTRVTLTFIAREDDLESLDPICGILLGPARFEEVRHRRSRSRNRSLIALSDTTDLSVGFPGREGRSGILGFDILAILGSLVSPAIPSEIVVRGDLPEIAKIAEPLAAWVATSGRRARLEVWEETHLEVEASTPDEVRSMFKTAAGLEDSK